MERVHYRRTTPTGQTRQASGAYTDEGGREGSRERLILQGIVSGLMLAAILGLCLFESGFSAAAREGLGKALNGYTTVEAAAEGVKGFGQAYLPVVFGEPEAAAPVSAPVSPRIPEEIPSAPPQTVTVDEGLYIDQDILAEMNASKSTVPEPPASPGP